RAGQMDLSTGEGKSRAVNFLLPYVQKIPNRILRSEWATRIAQQLRLEEPVLRAALSKAASERRSELKLQPELVGRAAKPVERRQAEQELAEVQRSIEANPAGQGLRESLTRKQVLMRRLAASR